MKKSTFAAALAVILLFSSCKNAPAPAATAATEETAIGDALRGFFNWYETSFEQAEDIQFAVEKKKHLTLDAKKLEQYLGEFKKSGFVSEEFLANETKYYNACAKIWQNETTDEPPTGLDHDRYYCAQDFIGKYSEGKTKSIVSGDRAKTALTVGTAPDTSDFEFEMKKENGKWLLARIGCDAGVAY